MIQTKGYATVVSDGAVAKGDRLKVSATTAGRVVTALATDEWFGVSTSTAGGAGTDITMIIR